MSIFIDAQLIYDSAYTELIQENKRAREMVERLQRGIAERDIQVGELESTLAAAERELGKQRAENEHTAASPNSQVCSSLEGIDCIHRQPCRCWIVRHYVFTRGDVVTGTALSLY